MSPAGSPTRRSCFAHGVKLCRQLFRDLPTGDAMDEHEADKGIHGAASAEVARREAELLARDYLTLNEPTREAVRAIAGECRRSGQRQEQVFAGGDVYAYAHPGGGIAWGVNDALGINIARGVERLPADLPPRVADLEDLRQLAMGWRRIDVGAALAEPATAKALLARANAEAKAGAAWQHSLDAQDRSADEARWLVNIGETRRQLIHNVVQSQAVHPDWRASFDRAGWASGPRIATATMLTALVRAMLDRALAPTSQQPSPTQTPPKQGPKR
jgi:hypothetical protein